METNFHRFNCYRLFELAESASLVEIKQAYRRLSKMYHPDLLKTTHTNKQVLLNRAYEILCEPHLSQSRTGNPIRPPEPVPANFYRVLERLKTKILKAVEVKKFELIATLHPITEEGRKYACALFRQKRRKSLLLLFFCLGSIFPGIFFAPFIILTSTLLLLFLSSLKVTAGTGMLFVFSWNWKNQIRESVRAKARLQLRQAIGELNLFEPLLASLMTVFCKPTLPEAGEEALAQRLTIAFFLQGYLPQRYDKAGRMLLFKTTDHKILVRYRHRPGKPVDVGYLKNLHVKMKQHAAREGHMFAAMGLSCEAKKYAREHNIQFYNFTELKQWIAGITHSTDSGPGENFLDGLRQLSRILNRISPFDN